MLIDLKILNGDLELKFNKYTYEYTVVVKNDITSLDIDYTLEDGAYLNIRNNIIDEDENIVYIDAYDEEKTITYTLYVYKEDIKTVNGIENYIESLEVANTQKEVSTYEVQILCVSMFLTIIILFSIIFRRRKYAH